MAYVSYTTLNELTFYLHMNLNKKSGAREGVTVGPFFG